MSPSVFRRSATARREFLRGAAWSTLLGLGFALVMYATAPRFFGPKILGHGVLVGFFAVKLGLVHPRIFSVGLKFVIINSLVAVPIGFVFYGFGVMRERLRQNVEQLKEKDRGSRAAAG